MKITIAWLCWSYLAPVALSSVLAGPYQGVFYWYAYRMDILTFGPGNTLIAPGCIGTGPGRSCYFDELLRYLQRPGDNTKWTGHTSVGTNLNPDVFSAAHDLADGGTAGTSTRYVNNVEPHYALPTHFTRTGLHTSYSDVYGKVVDNIQICRAQVPNPEAIAAELDGVRLAMESMVDARLHDTSRIDIEGVNKNLRNAGITWTVETKPVQAPDGSTWNTIDTEGTIHAHPQDEAAFRGAVRKYTAQNSVGKSSSSRHNIAIQASQSYQSRLLSDSTC